MCWLIPVRGRHFEEQKAAPSTAPGAGMCLAGTLWSRTWCSHPTQSKHPPGWDCRFSTLRKGTGWSGVPTVGGILRHRSFAVQTPWWTTCSERLVSRSSLALGKGEKIWLRCHNKSSSTGTEMPKSFKCCMFNFVLQTYKGKKEKERKREELCSWKMRKRCFREDHVKLTVGAFYRISSTTDRDNFSLQSIVETSPS